MEAGLAYINVALITANDEEYAKNVEKRKTLRKLCVCIECDECDRLEEIIGRSAKKYPH